MYIMDYIIYKIIFLLIEYYFKGVKLTLKILAQFFFLDNFVML